MRRRDYFRINIQTQDGVVPVETPKGIELRKPGQCFKCGKMVGRGLHFHTKACRGTMELK